MNSRRVVVTGLGAITPIGIGTDEFWSGLLAGRSGVGLVTHFDSTDYRSHAAAEVLDFDPAHWIDRKAARRMDRFTQFACAAAAMALEDADLEPGAFEAERAGVVVGSGIGGSQTIEAGYEKLLSKGPRTLTPFFVSKLLVNMAASLISIRHGLKGPMTALSVACSTGSNAVGDAMKIIQRGDAEIMIAGSSEASISPLPYGGFCAARSMSTKFSPAEASRPFDRDRDGFVMGEGAGITVLEDLDHALRRGARIYAEVVGYGCSADAYHFTAPDPEGDGMARAMQAAIQDAKLSASAVQYVNAHGTSTVLNDKCESKAIQKVFGESINGLKVSSNKSMIGHLMAAAGAVEFVATVKSIESGKIPPTINYNEPDPDCPLDYVANGAESINLKVAMSNSFGFGGGNACIVVSEFGGRE